MAQGLRNRALIIAWHKYQPHFGERHRVLFEHWLKTLPIWASEVDHLYLIDSDMGFTDEDHAKITKYIPKVDILPRELDGHHWVQFKWVIPKVTEDYMLFLDNDVVISQSGIIDEWFRSAESGADFVGSFDNSGGLKAQVQAKSTLMKILDYTRMGSYYFILTRRLLNKLGDYDFAPITYPVGTHIPELDYTTVEGDWSDSFGRFTIQMIGVKALMVPISDPRDTIYLQDDGTILLDSDKPLNLGYYHIRNGNLANYIMTSWAVGNRQDYFREIGSVKREILRSLAWFTYMDRKTNNGLARFILDIVHLYRDLGRSEEEFEEYMHQFKEYHKLP